MFEPTTPLGVTDPPPLPSLIPTRTAESTIQGVFLALFFALPRHGNNANAMAGPTTPLGLAYPPPSSWLIPNSRRHQMHHEWCITGAVFRRPRPLDMLGAERGHVWQSGVWIGLDGGELRVPISMISMEMISEQGETESPPKKRKSKVKYAHHRAEPNDEQQSIKYE
jgi:hypothetical protein